MREHTVVVMLLLLVSYIAPFCAMAVDPWSASVSGPPICCIHESAEFTCSITCDKPIGTVYYNWEVPPGSEIAEVLDGGKRIIVKNLIAGYGQQYSCTVHIEGDGTNTAVGRIDVVGVVIMTPPAEAYIPNGGSGKYTPTVIPSPGEITWDDKLLSDCEGKNFQPELQNVKKSTEFTFTVTDDSGIGYLKVTAKHSRYENCWWCGSVPIGCRCSSCSKDRVEHGLCSINSIFGLGSSDAPMLQAHFSDNPTVPKSSGINRDAGRIKIKTDKITRKTATPEGLDITERASNVEVVYFSGTQKPAQIKAPECFVNIVVHNEYKYEMRFYHSEDVESEKGADGYYRIKIGAVPYRVHTISNPEPETTNKLQIVDEAGGEAVTNLYVYDEGDNKWTLSSGNGLCNSSVINTTNQFGRVVEREIRGADNKLVAKTKDTYVNFDWGEELVEHIEDYGGAALTTKRFYYDDAPAYKYGKLAMIVNADGSWKRYDYDTNGSLKEVVSSWLDEPTNAAASEASAVYYGYSPVDSNDDGLVMAGVARVITNTIWGGPLLTDGISEV